MTERPILFSAEMVRAIFAGRKTQTRQIVKPQPAPFVQSTPDRHPTTRTDPYIDAYCGERKTPENPRGMSRDWHWWTADNRLGRLVARCPYGKPGDLLWVRETWAHYQTVNHVWRSDGRAFDEVSDGLVGYRADGHDSIEDFRVHVRLMSGCDLEHVIINGDRWRPSIHMPRWASRITLRITDVRVERLQDIREDDAVAEGVDTERYVPVSDSAGMHASGEAEPTDPIEEYRDLWNHINGAGAWEANPWVWAISFEGVKP